MPLDPGGGGYTSYPTSNARSIRRDPRTGQTAFVPYTYTQPSHAGSVARALGSVATTLNPVMAAERFFTEYQRSHENMQAYKKMSDVEKARFEEEMRPGPVSWQQSFGIPTSAEEVGPDLLAMVPVRMRGWREGEGYRRPLSPDLTEVDVNTYAGKPYPRSATLDEMRAHIRAGQPILTHAGVHDNLTEGMKATTAVDDRNQLVASASWEDPFQSPQSHMNANDIFIHPALRGNIALFRALTRGALQDSQRSGKPLSAYFANQELRDFADRILGKQGWKSEPGFFGPERMYTPPPWTNPYR